MSRKRSPRAQHQLAADVVELGFLRLRQRHAGVAEIGARIDAPRIEPERVEVVRDVVVELDLPRVGCAGWWCTRERAVCAPRRATSRAARRAVAVRRVVADHLRGDRPSRRACCRRCRRGPRRGPARRGRPGPWRCAPAARGPRGVSVTRGIVAADAPAARQHHRQRGPEIFELALEHAIDRDHRHPFAAPQRRAMTGCLPMQTS